MESLDVLAQTAKHRGSSNVPSPREHSSCPKRDVLRVVRALRDIDLLGLGVSLGWTNDTVMKDHRVVFRGRTELVAGLQRWNSVRHSEPGILYPGFE